MEALSCVDTALDFLEAHFDAQSKESSQRSHCLARGILLSARSAVLVSCDTVEGCFSSAIKDAEAAVGILRGHCTCPYTTVFLLHAMLREALARACFSEAEQGVIAQSRLNEALTLARSCCPEAEKAVSDSDDSALPTNSEVSEGPYLESPTSVLKPLFDLTERIEGARVQLLLPSFACSKSSSQNLDAPESHLACGSPELRGTGNGGGETFLALEDWLHGNNGGYLSSTPSTFPYLVGREYSEGVRGVHLRCDVDAECELLAVREEYILTVEKAKLHPCCQSLARAGVDRELSAAKHCYLAVYILCTKNDPSSHFAPYYNLLPTSFPSTPLFWAEEELKWLKGSYILEQVEDRKRNIHSDFRLITRAVSELEGAFSLDDFMWARMVVASRNFGITVDGVRTDALVPYADMLNHLRPRQTRWLYDSTRRAFLIVSLQPLAAGQQVFDSYGKKCNSRFLLNYGFTVAQNADDDTGQFHNELRLLLSLPPPASDPWHWQKADRLGGAV